MPDFGGVSFYDTISWGIDQELVQIAGSPATTYSSVGEYFNIMSHPYAYATNLEMIAAAQVYGVQFRVTLNGDPYPPPPAPHICDIIYYEDSLHYATLKYTSS